MAFWGSPKLSQAERRNYVELTDVDRVIQDVVRDATGAPLPGADADFGRLCAAIEAALVTEGEA